MNTTGAGTFEKKTKTKETSIIIILSVLEKESQAERKVGHKRSCGSFVVMKGRKKS